MEGDTRRFGRDDTIEEQWRIVEPLLEEHPKVQLYEEGTWGPPGGDTFADEVGGWVEPTRD